MKFNFICVNCGYLTQTEKEINAHCKHQFWLTQKPHKYLPRIEDEKRFTKLELESVY